MQLSSAQLQVVESPIDKSIFLSGPAGTGKTSAGVERIRHLVYNGIPGSNVLLLFPQRTLAAVYQNAINDISFNVKSLPVVATVGGLARRGIQLFWPLIAEQAGFQNPGETPHFLTLESSLYFVSQLITPLIDNEGFFSSITIQRNRLFSQILDNLNKSAVHGFSHTEIAERLNSSWIGDPGQKNIFHNAQVSASLFREHCYKNTLLDYSLQIELFFKYLVDAPFYKEHFNQQYSHLIFDNIEEDVPVAHDFITNYLDLFSSALLIYDADAGYRNFLGASPQEAYKLKSCCDDYIEFSQSFTTPKYLEEFNIILSWSLNDKRSAPPLFEDPSLEHENLININYQPYYPQLITSVATQISDLIRTGTSPDDIVVLAPFLSDSLRFILSTELNKLEIDTWSHRPSRPLRDEPATICLLTIAALAHPSWNILPSNHDLALTLVQAIEGLDLTRAKLLVKHCTINKEDGLNLPDFEEIDSKFQERITFNVGNRYQFLIDWINRYQENPPLPLDHFLIRLFGELLAQPGFGFHNNLSMGVTTEQIVTSVNNFRQSAGKVLGFSNDVLGSEYFGMVKAGVLANQYPKSWQSKSENSVYLLPAYTYLLSNTPVNYQFWLDVGSSGWYERIYQPLTNPHILNRGWEIGNSWSDLEEVSFNLGNLEKITTGLIRRCKKGLYFCLTETDERGLDQKGLLIQAINKSINLVRSS